MNVEREADMSEDIVFELKNITKVYPGTVALDNVNFELRRGEIHGLLGKNGAGKSTLTGIMYGNIQPSKGTITINGQSYSRITPWSAKKMGIFLVPQHTEFALDLSVAENLYLDNYPRFASRLIDKKKLMRDTQEIIDRLGIEVSPAQRMEHVSLEYRQLLLAAKAFWVDKADIILLDEITATLSMKSRLHFFALLNKIVNEENKSVVFITHRIQEGMEICNRVTVVRNGVRVATANVSEITASDLVYMITGSRPADKRAAEEKDCVDAPRCKPEEGLVVENLSSDGVFEHVGFELHPGEVVGLAGLEDSGGSEIMECLAGLRPIDTGTVTHNGRRIACRIPQKAIMEGIVYLTRYRETNGILQGCSVEHNVVGSCHKRYSSGIGLIDERKLAGRVKDLSDLMSIKMPSQKQAIDTLSGGNKQKVMIARLIHMQPRYYLLDHITQGIDIQAKQEILQYVRSLLSRDAGILISSESIEEMMQTCDRIIILFKGEIVKVVERKDFSEDMIFSSMQGLEEQVI